MSSVTAIRTRLTVCSTCGHQGRLIIATGREVISSCHVCGDELRTVRAVAVELPHPLVAAAPATSAVGA